MSDLPIGVLCTLTYTNTLVKFTPLLGWCMNLTGFVIETFSQPLLGEGDPRSFGHQSVAPDIDLPSLCDHSLVSILAS